MNFTAPAFVLAFPFVLALHWVLPPQARWVLLLAASLGFYAVGSPQALPLLAGITLGTYAAALGIAKSEHALVKKCWLVCAVLLCLGCLGVFKYAGLFGAGTSLLLPAGISFYTFQTLGYVIDVYRRRLKPERHLGYYALFVSFFPQLVAGPIERSTILLPQLHDPERRMDTGGWLWMVRGFAKKLLLADTAAVFVDAVYADPSQAIGPAVVLVTVLFAWQIYWDFSGYSDIAVGAAALLGVRLSRNFDHPYCADSLRDFWHRWHVSLTRWFTDYVYIPLGGSRCSVLRWAANTMVVFLLSGLWHGAALHYAVWGAVHGGLLIMEKMLASKGGRPNRLRTFALVCAAWVFFRAASVSDALTLFSRLLFGWTLADLRTTVLSLGMEPALQLALGALCLRLLPEIPSETPTPRGVLAFCLLTLAAAAAWFAALHTGTANAFIYFQF
ncbi:MBOAT family O-acyltransferase [uncultured Gemmiger sp.]|uniref:MBOAT family O-acyltransferase n=1 Tax=uncultured Gemmiger sp. TaxID=1623490 RepID=UPI0025E47F76|nr:MBOAT family O-acyltransferase [uncultured Gemmiger sp.]